MINEHIAAADYILAERFDEVPGPPAQWSESDPVDTAERRAMMADMDAVAADWPE